MQNKTITKNKASSVIIVEENPTVKFLQQKYKTIDLPTAVEYRAKFVELFDLLYEMQVAIDKKNATQSKLNKV